MVSELGIWTRTMKILKIYWKCITLAG
jgi:hypothetical protein